MVTTGPSAERSLRRAATPRILFPVDPTLRGRATEQLPVPAVCGLESPDLSRHPYSSECVEGVFSEVTMFAQGYQKNYEGEALPREKNPALPLAGRSWWPLRTHETYPES